MSRPEAIAIASAPMRISLAGGGTDLPSYAERHGGSVVSLAINRRVTVAASPQPHGEDVFDLLGGSTRMSHEDLMRNGLALTAMRHVGAESAQVVCASDAPPCSGLGGSGAFLVALVRALRASAAPEPIQLAEEASEIEMVDLRRPVGKQDHYAASLGGLQALYTDRDGSVHAEPIATSERFVGYVADRLLLFHTGLFRNAAQVLRAQDCQTRHAHGSTLARLNAIHSLVAPLLEAIREDRVDEIGPILSEHWKHKARLSEAVATPRAIELHELALESGADGGKLLGAGGGGYMLFSCRPGQQQRLRAAMDSAGAIELRFTASRLGATLWHGTHGRAVRALVGATEERS